MGVLDTVLTNLRKEMEKPSFPKEFEKWGQLVKAPEDVVNIWAYSGKDDPYYFKDRKHPTSGPEWDQALEVYLDKRLKEYTTLFKEIARTKGDEIFIARCITVDNAKDFVEAIKTGKAYKEFEGLGIYWSWNQEHTECHWGQSGQIALILKGSAKASEINYYEMALAVASIYAGLEEFELNLNKSAKITILSVEDDASNSLWAGKTAAKAHIMSPSSVSCEGKLTRPKLIAALELVLRPY